MTNSNTTDDEVCPNEKFRREFVYDACGIKRSVATQDAALFKTDEHPTALKQLAQWAKKPDDEDLSRQFGKMTVKQLVKWKEDKISERQIGKGGKGKGKEKAKVKRSRADESDNDGQSRRGSTSSKKPRRSSHVDSSSEESVESDDLDGY